MKRIASYLIALATMAFTFTSCEDVPSPFGEIVKPSGEEKVVIEPTGSGTEKDPYNVAAVLEYVSGLVASEDSPIDVYVQGIVTNVTEAYGTQYGNATFDISDDENGSNKFTFYRGLYFDNQKYSNTSDPGVAVGDKVVICGRVTNYKGNTPETSQGKAWLVSINGKGGSGGGGGGDTPTPGEAKGSGTQADPYNAAGANNFIKTLAADKESDKDIYIKGKLVKYADKGEFSKDFGNASFYLSDDGKESSEQFYVFRTLYLGNVKYTSGDTPKVGDEIIICGKVVNYKGNTPETAANKSYIYSWNGKTEGGGGGSDTPSGDAKGSGTEADPFNVAAAIAKCKETGETATTEKYYIKGIADADYTVSSYKNIEVDIVDAAGSADKFKVFRCKAADNKDIKEGFKVKKGDEIIVYGPVVNYKGNTPETANGAYVVSVNGKAPELDGGGESGGGEGGGSESGGGGSAATSLTNGDFETWANGLPTGWKSASTASSATLEQSTDAHGGKYSCNVKGDEGNNKRLATQEITLAAGTYVFSAWVKATTSDTSQARLGYVPIGADGKAGSYSYTDYANLNTSWQQFSYEFTLDSEKTICLVIMNPKKSSYSSGKDILVDDATLTKK